jgi:nitroreductase
MGKMHTGAVRRAVLCVAACVAGFAAFAQDAVGNDTLKLLSTAKTAKAFDSSRAVSEAQIKQIIAAGANAPSAMNKQPWYFSAVIGAKALDELRAAAKSAGTGTGGPGGAQGPGGGQAPKGGPGGDQAGQGDQPPAPPENSSSSGKAGTAPQGQPPVGGAAGGQGARDPLNNARAAIVISGLKEWRWTATDCAIACEAMALAAQSLGLGTHIVLGPIDALKGDGAAAIKKKLGVPTAMEPQMLLLVGYPADAIDATSKASTRNSDNFKILK